MPAAAAQENYAPNHFARTRALAAMVESPAPIFCIGLAFGIAVAFVGLLIVLIP